MITKKYLEVLVTISCKCYKNLVPLSLFVDPFGVVESVKAASDLYSPVTGEIVEVNETLSESPDLVNKEPYDGGMSLKLYLLALDGLSQNYVVEH